MIRLRDARKTYRKDGGPIAALDGVSLDVESGDFLAVLGPSGSGKSTLLNVVGLLDRADTGSYSFLGEAVAGLDGDDLATLRNEKIGFIFQSFHLLPRTTALENVELPLLYSNRREIAGLGARALQAVGLGDRASHHPGELSGGQQQRVAIARALVNDPDLILADEPTGNLDRRSGLEVMALLQRLNGDGRTVILITHDEELARMAGRMVRLVDGRVVADERVPRPSDAAELLATNGGHP
jgi:putative ABC transport system ATP-binding protein